MPHFSEQTLKYVQRAAFSTHPSAIHYEEALLTTENILHKAVIFKPVFSLRVFFSPKTTSYAGTWIYKINRYRLLCLTTIASFRDFSLELLFYTDPPAFFPAGEDYLLFKVTAKE